MEFEDEMITADTSKSLGNENQGYADGDTNQIDDPTTSQGELKSLA